jgi:hypothetical protein
MNSQDEVVVLVVNHKHGTKLSAYVSEEAMERGLWRDWVTPRWSDDLPPLADYPSDRDGILAAINDYFECNADESWVANTVPVQYLV